MDELKTHMRGEKIIRWPAKHKKQLLVLSYLAGKFKADQFYTETEINELLNKFHTFNDAPLLRRELYEKKFLDREKDGSKYWKTSSAQ